MNKKGQALVEFIIIIPIFIMLMLAVFDYAKIMQTKFALETHMEEIILNDIKPEKDEELTIDFSDTGLKKYILKKNINIFSPVLSVFMGTNYEIKCERVLYE